MTYKIPKTLPPDWTARAALDEITQDLQAVAANLAAIQTCVAQLEAAGVVQASAYWRKDRAGNPTILYLNHSSQNGQRRREYVGKDPAKQADALLRIERWEQRQHLLQQANHLTTYLNRLQRNIRAIQLTAADLRRQTTELIPQEETA